MNAVFLSYASQDAEAARRICDALRAAGIEVWFDQSELRGGDSWDQKIRRQIKECALFVPVVSANTQSRREGYFRLEWKLADDRTHLMAKGTPFVVPVCVDDTKDWDALVPDSFMSVQWTWLPDGETPGRFVERIGQLLAGGSTPPQSGRRPSSVPAGPVRMKPRRWLAAGLGGVGLLGGLLLAVRFVPRTAEVAVAMKKPGAAAPTPAAVTPAAVAVSGGVQLAGRARALYDKIGFGRDDLVLADDFAKRATDAEPTVAFCWGVRAHVQAAFLFRGFAVGDEFVQRARNAQSFANRALALQADEAEALLALGRVATYQRAYAQAEQVFNRALAAHPDDVRIRRALGTTLRYQPKRVAESLTVLQEAVRRAPRDPLAHYDLAMGYRDAWDFAHSWAACDAAIGLQPFGTPLLQQASMAIVWKGNVAAMRAALDRLAPAEQTEDRAVLYAMWCGLVERQPERVVAAAALTSRDYLEDSAFAGPKAWFPAVAYETSGKENLARSHWQAAEALLRERLRADPKNNNYRYQLARTLAWLGAIEESGREIAPIEAAWRELMNPFRASSLASYYAAVGDAARTVAYLRQSVNRINQFTHQELRIDPWWDKVRTAPEFQALLAAPPPMPAPIAPAPYLGSAAVSSPATPAAREAEQLLAQARGVIAKASYTRDNLAVAEELTRRATELVPESARAWAARAVIHAFAIQRTWDRTEKRRQDTQAFASRALALDPDEAEAMVALSIVLTFQGGAAQAETLLRRALELRPADALIRRRLAVAVADQGREAEALSINQAAARLFPDDPLVVYDLGLRYMTGRTRDADAALQCFEAAITLEPFSSAILNKVLLLAGVKADIAAARSALNELAPVDRGEDRAVSFAMWLGLLERQPARVTEAAALTARTYFEDAYFRGPKAAMLAVAAQVAGKPALAQQHWQMAEAVLRERLKGMPNEILDQARLGVALAWLGRSSEVAREMTMLESTARESPNAFLSLLLAQYHTALGDAGRAVPYLRRMVNIRDTLTDRTLPLDPWWDKLRGAPEFEALLAEGKARRETGKR